MRTRANINDWRIVAEFRDADFCRYSAHTGVRVKIYKVGKSKTPLFADVIGVPMRRGQTDLDILRDAISAAFSFAMASHGWCESTQEISELEFLWYEKPYNKERARREGYCD